MGLFGKKHSSVVVQPVSPPAFEPPTMTPEQVLAHAGFQRGWRADPIWVTHQRKHVVNDLFDRYGYAAMPAWCTLEGETISVSIEGQLVGYIPKSKVRKVSQLGEQVAALASMSGNESAPKVGIFISSL